MALTGREMRPCWPRKVAVCTMREVDTSALDGKCITALLMGAIRADRFSEGALLHFFEAGTITKWLNRLKEIDEKKSLD